MTCSLVFSYPAGRLCVLDVTIKEKVFRCIGIYGFKEVSTFFGASALCDVIEVDSLSWILKRRP